MVLNVKNETKSESRNENVTEKGEKPHLGLFVH